MMKRLVAYTLVSVIVSVMVVGYAFAQYQQFYPSMLLLSQLRMFSVLLVNSFALTVTGLFLLIKLVFLGNLRDEEAGRATENTVYHLMESLLALTIFAERISMPMVAMLVLCVVWKIFHWLTQSRLEFIEITPAVGKGQLFRLSAFLLLLVAVDSAVGQYLIHDILEKGRSVKLLLVQDLLIMAVMGLTTFCRLLIHLFDLRQNHRWEGKGTLKFYLEIVSDILQCIIFIVFFFVIISMYGLPINLLREMIMKVRSLFTTLNHFLNYRRLAAHLDQKFLPPTAEELAADSTCSICFDEMVVEESRKLHCGHIFHRRCLRQLLERQTICPYCRQKIDMQAPPPAPAEETEVTAEGGTAVPPGTSDGNQPTSTPVSQGGFVVATTTVNVKPPTEAEIMEAYRAYSMEYDMAVQRQGSTEGATTSTPAASTTSVPVLTGIPSLDEVKRHVPTLEEAEAYKDFHLSMHQAYSELCKRLKEKAENLQHDAPSSPP